MSAGYGIEQQLGWVKLLEAKLQAEHFDYKVVNASISGDTTSNGLSRLPPLLAKYKPSITIIELGGNDGLRGLNLENIKNNLQSIIQLAKDASSDVLLIGIRLPPNFGSKYTQTFNENYLILAKENNIQVVPFLLKGIDENTTLMQSDGIHPRAEAQAMILNNLWPTLKGLLKQ